MIAFWFRRDMRLYDNVGLHHALKQGPPVLPVFIFDKEILDPLPIDDARITFIHRTLHEMEAQLREKGSALVVRYGNPEMVWKSLVEDYSLDAVYTNRDYEPYARERDPNIAALLAEHDIPFRDFKDHVIFEKREILTGSGTPYKVYSPYARKWRTELKPERDLAERSCPDNYWQTDAPPDIPTLESMGFEASKIPCPTLHIEDETIAQYGETRNYPHLERSTTNAGMYLRFGTLSPRELLRKAQEVEGEVYQSEIIWRDFFSQLLWNFPHVAGGPFRREYENMVWRDDEADFARWCEGKTGFPLVDAGMRELNATGYMHNRVRMLTANFLIKYLLIDWRWGEAYFAEKLLDFDLASNNGNWQWVAGTGADAAPYFRLFSPARQQEKFDPDFTYIRKWVPEFGTGDYPEEMVDLKMARERALNAYKLAREMTDA